MRNGSWGQALLFPTLASGLGLSPSPSEFAWRELTAAHSFGASRFRNLDGQMA